MKKIKEILKPFGLIILYFILSALSSYYVFLYVPKLKLEDSQENITISILLLICELIYVLIFTLLLKNKLKGQFKDFKKNYKDYLPKCFKYWAIGFTCLIIINALIIYFVTGGIAPNEEANREIIEKYPLYAIISVSLIGPYLEELIFRLSFKGVIKKRIPYILITGIIFGSMHVIFSLTSTNDLFYILSYSSLGIAFGTICYDTDNIYSSMLVHIFHNTLTLLIILNGI